MGGLSWLSFSADSFSPNSWKFTAVAELVRSVFRTVVILPENRAYIVKSDVRQAYIPDEKTDIVSDDIVFEEFLTDARTFDDTSYASMLTLLADINTFADATSITVNAAWSDANVTAEDSFTSTSVVFSDGITRTYFAGDYAAEDYGTTDNFVDDLYTAIFLAQPLADANTITDAAGAEVGIPLADAASSNDAQHAALEAVFADGTTYVYFAEDYSAGDYGATDCFTEDVYAAAHSSAAVDAATTSDASYAALVSSFSDGTTYTYFAEDYAAGDYGATDNFIDEAYSAVSTTAFNDSQTTTDARSVEMIHVAADSHTNTEARTAVFGAVAGDAITVSDASGGLWTFPNWADAAVPIDSVALALTVASTDTSSTSDATSATIQNYALDPTYFSGDYATTPY